MTMQRMWWATLLLLFTPLLGVRNAAAENDDCFMCHGEEGMTGEVDGEEVSIFVESDKFDDSVHGGMECIECHQDLDGVELPHDDDLERVDCAMCHDSVAEIYTKSLHGRAVAAGEKLAPQCSDCHGKHDISFTNSPDSSVAKFKIPVLCGTCHKEGSPVTRKYNIPQEKIFSHYSQSIHGEGLFKQGLTVTAVCSDCHTAHNVLPHTDPESSIYHQNVPKTCQKCHGLIEEVHQQVIEGELWEKEPDKVPVCVDCHRPHELRRVDYQVGISDRECLQCHGKKDLTTTRNGEKVSLYVDKEELHDSIHRQKTCVQCHTGADPNHPERACATVPTEVDCAICHAEQVDTYAGSIHGKLVDRGDPAAPECGDCHGTHGILGRQNSESPTYPTQVPELCGRCHREGEAAAVRYTGEQHNIVSNYTMSIHGKGLLESGLVVTAMCTDCHTAHDVRPHADPASSVSDENIPETCARCHKGIYEKFQMSIHSKAMNDTDKELPLCNDCHNSHTISRTDQEGFKLQITDQCGECHEAITETYFETFHGKVSKLGFTEVAKCYDCHGSHEILPPSNTESMLSRDNIVSTCGKCHPGSHRQFAGYLTHATHHDRDKYPILFYTFWFMTLLLVGTLTVFGIHTLLWLPRSFATMKETKKLREASKGVEVMRFESYSRVLHVMIIVSFLGLALTGMILKFSYLGWARWLVHLLGGFESAGFIHRVCAVITFAYFGLHLYDVLRKKNRGNKSWFEFLFGPDSMVPNKRDLQEAIGTVKWFIGMGPRPRYGRWTYWEKFDYFAVFWGVAVIGFTGLMLWFPEFFTLFMPGWIINVATIIHSDEALLASGFIFTVHFFNTHFRPDRFPMDTVIFTGRVPLEEFKHERPREYEEMVEKGELDKHLVEPLPKPVIRGMKVFGTIALLTGLTLIFLIIYAEVFGYR